MEPHPEKTTARTSTKPSVKRKFAGFALVLAVLLVLILVGSVQENKLQATLSDGTIVKIEKVEVSKEPRYDSRNFLQRMGGWLQARGWERSILKVIKIDLPSDAGVFTVRGRDKNEIFHVWYSLSDPRCGFFSDMADDDLVERGTSGSSMRSFSSAEVALVDEDGCSSSKGWMTAEYQKFGETIQRIHGFSFEGFNNASEKQKLVINFPGEKQPVIFILKNPSPRKWVPASAMASSIPIKQSLGDASILLSKLTKTKNAYNPWKPEIHFERNNANADKDYTTVEYTLSDSQGGDKDDVCARAGEWILKGVARKARVDVIESRKRIQLENLVWPQPQEWRPIDLTVDAKKFVLRAYLVGAGTYVLDSTEIVSVGGVDELEKQKSIFAKIPHPRNVRTVSSLYSGQYGRRMRDQKSFYWEQEIFGKTTSKLLLLTDKPTLLFRAAPENTEHAILLISGASAKWNSMRGDFSDNKWDVIPLDWKETDGPQSIKIGYAEAIPFEFHILPTDEMRQALLVSPKTKPNQ
ncbi:MAG: hypothetical protein LBV12_12575 [Puniceicoccales bacterium]|jgi:hypothetical protein|nr:hypothetical protein [Puniceicoccales bacterium]